MPAYNTVALVLRRINFGETDKILTLYSPDRGRFSAIAKGARKAVSRLSGATEALTCTRFQLASGKSLEIVTQAEVVESFTALRQDLFRMANGLYLADLVEHSVEDHEPNRVLFELLMEGLSRVQLAAEPDSVARWFEIHLLRDLGYAPQLTSCSFCNTPLPGRFDLRDEFGMSAAHGGALCPYHAHPQSDSDHTAITGQAVSWLQSMDDLQPGNAPVSIAAPDSRARDQVQIALRKTVRYRLERDLKSIPFLDSLRGTSG